VDASQLTFFGYGVLLGLALACAVAISGWRRRRELDTEVRRLHSHLHDQMEINHEGSKQIKVELQQLRQENENLRITLQSWKQKPDRRELHLLLVYDDAIRRVVTNVPGFPAYWENALKEAEDELARADRGLVAFARRLLPRARKPRPPPEEGTEE
jgi:hypothetical protein